MSNYIVFFLPALVSCIFYFLLPHGEGRIDFVYATLAFIFIVIPLVDLLPDFTQGRTHKRSSSALLSERVIPVLSLPVQLGNVFFFAWYVHQGSFTVPHLLLTVVVAGILSALYGQNPAHELIHHRTLFERVVGVVLFSTSFYTGAKLAHLHSHHVLVATKQDPTSAGYGKSLYQFLPGAVAVNLFGWWGRGRDGRRPSFSRKIVMENLSGYALSAVWAAIIYALFGAPSLLFLIGQSMISILVLEMMNYIGHYGLERRESHAGTLENIAERHAWDCDKWFSNLVLINVQKHVDHHMHPNKEYVDLACVKDSPRLPLSYPLLFLLTLAPPLWRKVIHPRLETRRIAGATA